MKSNYKRLGEYIEFLDARALSYESILDLDSIKGISSIYKEFIKTKANLIGVVADNYKVVEKGSFAYNPNTARMGDKIPIALNQFDYPVLVSTIYPTFKIKYLEKLIPEYLMMWFRRPEFDRYARFMSHGSAREVFDIEEMNGVMLPVPHPDKQKEIVKEYNTILNRIALNNQLIQKLEETAQAIYKQWFVDFEFPNEEGKPYKSSGGEMESEIPVGWEMRPIGKVCEIKAGGDKPTIYSEVKTSNCSVPIFSNGITDDGLYGYTNKANYPKNSITISARGTIGFSVLRNEAFDAIVRLLVLIPKQDFSAIYFWQAIRKMEFDDSGSVQNQLTVPQVSVLNILLPSQNVLRNYDSILRLIYNKIEIYRIENSKLSQMKNLLLSKLATIEN